MLINEAVKATTPRTPYIRRKSWDYPVTTPGIPFKILPTDSPDCCVAYSIAAKSPCRGWQPTAGDLIADDWEVVGL